MITVPYDQELHDMLRRLSDDAIWIMWAEYMDMRLYRDAERCCEELQRRGVLAETPEPSGGIR